MPSNEPKPVDLDALERRRDASVQNSLINWDAFRRYRDEVMTAAPAIFQELRPPPRSRKHPTPCVMPCGDARR